MNSEIEDNIQRKVPWENLPTHVKQLLADAQKEYDKCIVSFSIRNQLRYRGNLVRNVLKNEKRYYERIIAFSRENFMLFPYHLADMIVKGLRITPFSYYISVVERIIQADKSYDILPNFTAADCLRLLGIGRNEYIELMTQSKSGRRSLFGRKNVRGLLPALPNDIHIEPWWRVEVGLILEDDVKTISQAEKDVIDKLIDLGSQTASDLDFHVVRSLYRKGLIYLDVPITGVDRVQVPPLQGFIMNRVLGDYFETLLYKIFVSIDEHMTVSELAAVLQVDTESVKQAVSWYCRLGFAIKCNADQDGVLSRRHPSWLNRTSPKILLNSPTTPLTFEMNSEYSAQTPVSSENESATPTHEISRSLNRSGQRVAFLFDSTLTAFLMMGNLSPGLKSHAVTMFEVGKLSDESLDGLITELDKVSVLDAEGEGEARRYFDHAVILRSTVLVLRNLLPSGLDLVRCESLHSLDSATCKRLLNKKYKLLVSMAPLSREVHPISSISPPQLGPAIPEVNSIWFKLFIYHMTGYGPPSLLLIKGMQLKCLPHIFLGFSHLLITAWRHEPAIIPATSITHVNSALRYSAVLIQAYGVNSKAFTTLVPFPKISSGRNSDKGENLSDWNTHPAVKHLSETIDLVHCCGYLTMVNLGVRDIGCESRDPVVRLGKNTIKGKSFQSQSGDKNMKINEHSIKKSKGPVCISNENFYFPLKKSDEILSNNSIENLSNTCDNIINKKYTEIDTTDSKDKVLQSPVESYFANSPVNQSKSSSPANGFTSQECTDLLCQELDELDKKESNKPDSLNLDTSSFESLLSPTDENISMFTRISNLVLNNKELQVTENDEMSKYQGEEWTLLDCCFGVPLFDVDANTHICQAIISEKLIEPESLLKLTESNQKLGNAILEFITQCQYLPGECQSLTKRGRTIQQPKLNLVFDNGRVNTWNEK